MVRSFDVFDTSVTRLVGRPASVFLLLGHMLVRRSLWSQSAEQFAASRVQAELRARCNTAAQEVTLKAIYAELAYAHELAIEVVESFGEIEVQLEAHLLRAIPETVALIRVARAKHERIIFLSDTYFPTEVVRKWLLNLHVAEKTDYVEASSALGVTKERGDLFREVMRQRAIAPSAITHFGDNIVSDVSVPSSLGISAHHFSGCKLSEYEEVMEAQSVETGGLSSIFAGASRWVRLSIPAGSGEVADLRDMAAQVAGPVICAYVLWLLRKAESLGLRRLLFVSRDGQIMLKVAKLLAQKLGVDVEMTYLYGGRQVFNLAAFQEMDAEAIGWLLESATLVTMRDILERADIEISNVLPKIESYGLPKAGKISPESIDALKAFLADREISAEISKAAERRRIRIRKYLAACGLADPVACGIVDIGWKGRVFKALQVILSGSSAERRVGLYFGLFGKPQSVDPQQLQAFLFEVTESARVGVGSDIPALANVMEIFCQADHGQVLDVVEDGGSYVPQLRVEESPGSSKWDVTYFQQCVEAYADILAISPEWNPEADLRGMCSQLIRKLMTTPSLREAQLLGAFRYNDDQNGAAAEPLSVPFRVLDFTAVFRQGGLPRKSHVWWETGALTMTNPNVFRILRLARWMSRVRSAARRLFM